MLLLQYRPAIAGLLSKVDKECVKTSGGKGALMVLAAILLYVDGTSVVDKYFAASGLANAGCSLRK